MNRKIFTPRRVIEIIFIFISFLLYSSLTKLDFEKYNMYPEDDTEVLEAFSEEREVFIEDFFNKLAENKYEEAYAMLTPEAKKVDFKTIEEFSNYFKEHIIDNNKIKKQVQINYKRSENTEKSKNFIYYINLYINEKDMEGKNFTFDEILYFYDIRSFHITVVQTKPYEYKIYIAKPNIPFTKEELEEYIKDNPY